MNQKKIEKWKPIQGYEGIYEVSNRGRVRNRHGKILKQGNKQHTDYKRVHLARNNSARWFLVHRLVAVAFIPQEEGRDIVNHLDHDKSNNDVDNLEWTTVKDNCAYAAEQGRYKTPHSNLLKGRGLLKTPVIATDKDGVEYRFESVTQGARILNVPRSHVGSCCRNVYGRKTAGGYSWRYE